MLVKIALGSVLLSAISGIVIAGPNCTCRYAGQNYKTGSIMCIRGKLSRCDFVLNNTSWKTIAETCPQVMGPDFADKKTVLARMQDHLFLK